MIRLTRVLVLVAIIVSYEHHIATQSVLNGYKNYTRLSLGNINIIISAPHGGSLTPVDIANRTEDALGNLVDDMNSKEIAKVIRSELNSLFQRANLSNSMPFMIENNLRRLNSPKNRLISFLFPQILKESRWIPTGIVQNAVRIKATTAAAATTITTA